MPHYALSVPTQFPAISLVDSNGNVFFPASSPTPGTVSAAEPVDPNRLAIGEETIPRINASTTRALSTGAMFLSYFTARKTEAITSLRTISIVAGTSMTLNRCGIYSVATNGDLTLLAAIANDATIWAGANTEYTRALTTTFNKVTGTRYAFAALSVQSGTAPTIPAQAFAGSVGTANTRAPRQTGFVSGQTDLPASVASASVSAAAHWLYAELVP